MDYAYENCEYYEHVYEHEYMYRVHIGHGDDAMSWSGLVSQLRTSRNAETEIIKAEWTFAKVHICPPDQVQE